MCDSLVSQSGQRHVLRQIESKPEHVTVYNFTVDELHTYFVGQQAILVHNSGPCDLASSPKNNNNLQRLNKQLASEEQMGQKGAIIAGPGARNPLRKAAQLAQDHGGDAADYVKRGTTSYPQGKGKMPFEIHFEENVKTGERFNVKTKIAPDK